jgi:metal-responsive CopG/Arc/MetJ family transcriptional regulator
MILDRRRMVAKLSDVVQRLNLLVPADWVTAVDQWRGHQPGVPNRSEAIRRLVLEALEAGAKGAKPKGKPKG